MPSKGPPHASNLVIYSSTSLVISQSIADGKELSNWRLGSLRWPRPSWRIPILPWRPKCGEKPEQGLQPSCVRSRLTSWSSLQWDSPNTSPNTFTETGRKFWPQFLEGRNLLYTCISTSEMVNGTAWILTALSLQIHPDLRISCRSEWLHRGVSMEEAPCPAGGQPDGPGKR